MLKSAVSCDLGQESKRSWIQVVLFTKLNFSTSTFFPRVFVGTRWDNVYTPECVPLSVSIYCDPVTWGQTNKSTIRYCTLSSDIEKNMVHLEKWREIPCLAISGDFLKPWHLNSLLKDKQLKNVEAVYEEWPYRMKIWMTMGTAASLLVLVGTILRFIWIILFQGDLIWPYKKAWPSEKVKEEALAITYKSLISQKHADGRSVWFQLPLSLEHLRQTSRRINNTVSPHLKPISSQANWWKQELSF